MVIREHDIFSHRGFGKSGREICEQLKQGPKTKAQLVENTGRHRTTVKNRLQQMSRIIDHRTGELCKLVYCRDGLWFFNQDLAFDVIAGIVGVDGVMRKREWNYENDSENFRQLFTQPTNKG